MRLNRLFITCISINFNVFDQILVVSNFNYHDNSTNVPNKYIHKSDTPFKYRSSHLQPIIIDRCLLLTTKRCVIITSSVGSYRSQYITISSSFTDAFLPSSPHNTSIHLALRRLCYRRCLIAGMYPSEAIIVASQCLSKR